MEYFEIRHKDYAGSFFIRTNGESLADFLYIRNYYFNGLIFIEIFDEGISLTIEECEIYYYNTKL